MSTATYSYTSPPHKDRTGMACAEGCDIPKMRPRTRARDLELVKQLDEVLDELSDTPCCFWACRGPRILRNMVTCRKCQAMRTVASVRATLAHRIKVAGDAR